MKTFTKWFTKKIGLAVAQAGPRYSPKVNVPLPINRVLYGLGRTDEYYLEFSELRQEFIKEWDQSSLKGNFKTVSLPFKSFDKLTEELNKIIPFFDRVEKAGFENINFDVLDRIYKKAYKALIALDNVLRKAVEDKKSAKVDDPAGSGSPSASERLQHFIYEVRKIQELIYKLGNIPKSDFAQASNKRAILLLGEAGIGKTHLLCDIAEARMKHRLPTILVLGQQLQFIKDPLETIIGELGLRLTKKQFLVRLNNMAKNRKRRVLILIDAINEGDRRGWKKGMSAFLKEINSYDGLSVALSCRTPFEKITVPARAKLLKVYHHGFTDHELDALKTYTSYYKLPLPEIPILTPEFTNPLFLKLFCESLEDAVIKKKHRRIKEISSGQEGMNNIFEDIVIAKSAKIAKQFKVKPQLVWGIIKNDVASKMAQAKRSWLALPDMMSVLSSKFRDKRTPKLFLRALLNESLLSEDVYYDYEGKKYFEVVRFPYQKFSDHIITRHLLAHYFNKNKIRESFKKDEYLGWLFKDERSVYDKAGIIEALIIEFPNRINNNGELFDYLSVTRTDNLAELFINGLYWRNANCFNKSTSKWVNRILNHDSLREKILNVLLALATKPKHPYNSFALHGYLTKLSMQDRDLLWSEFLRGQYESDTAYKLLNWVESFKDKVTEDYAKMYILILNWFLTSTNRPLRDRATRGLYYLGRKYPSLLFTITIKSLALNDPYIPERMMAASYGVVMALHYQDKKFNRTHLAPFAKQIFKLMFSRKSKYGTTHILIRDYAKHIIDIALLHVPGLLSATGKKLITPPFKYGGIRKWGESEDLDKDNYRDGSSPMHMDFENYTLGRLVDGRSNYDFEHNGYKKIRANIFWRVYNLGYSHEKFKNIDSDIGRYNWNRKEHIKVDRYGKKYCWTAFYELAGYREDKGLLPEKYGGRISDTDIDPSFPDEPKEEEIIKTDYTNGKPSKIEDWIEKGPVPDVNPYLRRGKVSNKKGPWILLDGFIVQEKGEFKRNIFIYTRGLLVPKENKDQLVRSFELLEYPGNGRLPESESDYYTFAGEIPWCETYPYCQYEKHIEIPTGKKEIVREKILNFEAEVPVRNFSWESGRSIVNPGPHAYVPSKELCEHLNLQSRPQTFDMYDSKGRIGSIMRRYGDVWHTGHKLIYLRQDLLDRYLKDKALAMIWVIWGERRFHMKEEKELKEFAENHKTYHVYKYLKTYQPGRG